MKFDVSYGTVTTHIAIHTGPLASTFGIPQLCSIYVTEVELRDILRDYLKQRAVYRRQMRFVDPSVA